MEEEGQEIVKLALQSVDSKPSLENGVIHLNRGQKRMLVVDSDTGEEVENIQCCAWLDRETLVNPMGLQVFTPEHFPETPGDYLLLVVPCEKAIGG